MNNMEKPITRRKVLMYALFHNHQYGLCRTLYKALEHFNIIPASINAYFLPYMFPLFTYENAAKFGARDFQSWPWHLRFNNFWWEPGRWIFTGRSLFHLWLLIKYWNDETDLKQLCENFKIL